MIQKATLLVLVTGITFTLTASASIAAFEEIPNSSLEEGQDKPTGWEEATYGDNNPTFEYVNNDAHDGEMGIKVVMQDYQSGDAKWRYPARSVESGSDYQFSAWYKTDTVPQVVAEYTHKNKSLTYFGMPRPEPNGTDWQEYIAEFSVPEDVVAVSIFFFLSSNGWLVTDEYTITPYEYEGLRRPLVTLTFDDGSEENVESALPIMDRLGMKSTQCYTTGHVESSRRQKQLVQEFVDSGHEICSHSVTHPDFTRLASDKLHHELTHPRVFLHDLTGEEIKNFATPFGAYNANVIAESKKYYYSHRTVDAGYNAKNNLDPYRLKVQNMLKDTTLTEFQGWINKAIEENLWLILVYHKVDDERIRQYDTFSVDFEEQMEWLATTGVVVKRLDEALDEVIPQTTIEYNPHIMEIESTNSNSFVTGILRFLKDKLFQTIVFWK